MSGDAHVRFWESAGVKLPRATHLPSSPLGNKWNVPCYEYKGQVGGFGWGW